jgi:hypothetical protein
MSHFNSLYSKINSLYYDFYTKNNLLCKGQSFRCFSINSSLLNTDKTINMLIINYLIA